MHSDKHQWNTYRYFNSAQVIKLTISCPLEGHSRLKKQHFQTHSLPLQVILAVWQILHAFLFSLPGDAAPFPGPKVTCCRQLEACCQSSGSNTLSASAHINAHMRASRRRAKVCLSRAQVLSAHSDTLIGSAVQLWYKQLISLCLSAVRGRSTHTPRLTLRTGNEGAGQGVGSVGGVGPCGQDTLLGWWGSREKERMRLRSSRGMEIWPKCDKASRKEGGVEGASTRGRKWRPLIWSECRPPPTELSEHYRVQAYYEQGMFVWGLRVRVHGSHCF